MSDEDVAGVAEAMMAEMTVHEDALPAVTSYDCEICNKEFKSENQLTAHQASKVHRKKVSELAKQSKKKGGGGDKKKGNNTDES